jgi:hypothetical protein
VVKNELQGNLTDMDGNEIRPTTVSADIQYQMLSQWDKLFGRWNILAECFDYAYILQVRSKKTHKISVDYAGKSFLNAKWKY